MDKEALLKPRLPEREVELPGVGIVRVRALSREESLTLQGLNGDVGLIERKMLAMGMVDPPLTEDEVMEWYRASPAGELEPVSDAIVELSGLKEEAAKAAYKSVRGEPG